MHTHEVPIKSAEAILDEFQFGPTFNKQNFPLRPPTYASGNQQETGIKKKNNKLSSPKSLQRNQNLLYSIGGNFPRQDDENFDSPHGGQSNLSASTMQIKQIQRRLISFFFFILLLSLFIIVTLHLIVAAFGYYQQSATFKRSQQHQLVIESLSSGQLQQQQQQQLQQTPGAIAPASSALNAAGEFEQDSESFMLTGASRLQQLEAKQTKLEDKLHWLERQYERLAIDHEDTKNRLREREKCACSIGCSFNGTDYSDGQRWQQKCDVCQCQSGKISCVARECPKLSCEDQVQLPGQCCPSCMKKCKINTKLVRHGHTFQPNSTSGEPLGKRCTCHDGLIKCEQLELLDKRKSIRAQPPPVEASRNKTIEYLRSIMRNPQVQLLQKQKASSH